MSNSKYFLENPVDLKKQKRDIFTFYIPVLTDMACVLSCNATARYYLATMSSYLNENDNAIPLNVQLQLTPCTQPADGGEFSVQQHSLYIFVHG